MKFLFFVLLFANVAYFLWEVNIELPKQRNAAQQLEVPSTPERLVLIGELPEVPRKPVAADTTEPTAEPAPKPDDSPPTPAAEAPATSTEPAEAAPAPEPPAASTEPAPVAPPPREIVPEPVCYEFGPYFDNGEAQRAGESIKAAFENAQVISQPSEAPDGYWVIYPPAADMAQARTNRDMLVAKGVKDLWVFDKGELQGAISLGLYQSRDRAEALQKKFFDQEIDVEIRPRLTRKPGWWVRWATSYSERELREKLGDKLSTSSLLLRTATGCPKR